MQKINNIEIKNFKSIRHQTIDGCKRINVFIGYPNTGKSNILEALSIFSVDNTILDLSNLIRSEKLTTFFYNGDITQKGEVIINEFNRFSLEFLKSILRFTHEFDFGHIGFDNLDKNLGSSRDKIIQFEIKENDSRIYNFSTFSKREENLLPEIKKYDFINKVHFENGQYYSLKHPFGNNLFDIISTNEILLKEITEIFETYGLELFYDSRSQEFQILKRIGIKGFTVPYNLIADTLRRVIFYKAAILSNKETVLLFEEPEAHMFPPYVSKFTTDVIFDKNDNQYFVSTHSPFVINDFMENLKNDELSIYVVGYKKETGETIIRRLTDEELHEIYQYGIDLYFNLENYLMHEQQ
jgi:AAA15 family ATPase/GTPase